MPKNVQTTTQLYSSHMSAKKGSKIFKPGFSNMWTENLQMFKLGLEKAEEPEIKLPTCQHRLHHQKAREFQKNIYFCDIDHAKAFDCVDHYKLWKILKEMRIPHHLTCLPRIRYAAQEATGRIGHRTGSNLEKEYIKVVYCHHAYLTYMPSTSCDMLGSMKHKLESRLLRKI